MNKKIIIALLFFGVIVARAQTTPQFLVSWKSGNYTPPEYIGKTLPSFNSPVLISFELINAGRPVDLSKNTIQWFINDSLFQSGAGIQKISFFAPSTAGTLTIQIKIPDWNGVVLIKNIEIPVVSPEAVVETPFSGTIVSTKSFKLVARPYFFNIPNLQYMNYTWTIDGKNPEKLTDPETLNISIRDGVSAGTHIGVSLLLQNPNNILESAQKTLDLIYSP